MKRERIRLARVLSQSDYGSYRQLFLIYTTLSTILLLGLPQSMLYFIPKLSDEAQRRRFIARSVDLVSLLALIMTITILIFRPLISKAFSNPQLYPLLIVFAFYPLYMFVSQIYSAIMMGRKQADKVVKFSIFSMATDLVLILGTAVLIRKLEYIVLGLMIAAFAQWLYARISLRREGSAYEFNWDEYKRQFKYSLPIGLSSIIGILAVQLDKIVISGYFNPAQYAVFAVGAMELPFIGILVNSVYSVVLPAMSSSDSPDDLAQLYRGAVRKNALLVFPLAVLFFVLASDVMSFLYSVRYEGAAVFFRIYLLTLPIRVGIFGMIFQAANRTKYIMQNSILTLLANLALNLILVNTGLKMQGPAIATVVVTYLSAVIYLWLIHFRLGYSLRKMFPTEQLIRTLFASLLAGAIVYPFLLLIDLQLVRLIVVPLLFLILYLGLAYWSKALLAYDLISMSNGLRESLRKLKK
ncbi:MAG: oligosaccharide flippase family protein [Candidatus Cloacimonadota bacterium]